MEFLQTFQADRKDEVKEADRFFIANYEKPAVYNKIGLFELMQKGPVAVALGLDPRTLAFYSSDVDDVPYLSQGYYRPSVYGVVMEYHQYAQEGQPEYASYPYFAVETHLLACSSITFRLPILDSEEDSNVAGIAGFAIRPIISDQNLV